MNKEEQYAIKVTDMERRILIKALTLLKEKQIKEDKNYDFIDDLIIKLVLCQDFGLHKYEKFN